ncbi:hypothetical protein HY032_03355, partial [Candidatus Gottesmanbacteria bacterium]|nr:hypothetical protein [Candidatus Gottesmanbacteria bacterium]
LAEGMNTYWYANATRFIPYTIHEFPGYSFVVSDVHGHVLSIPFVLLAIAMLINMAIRDKQEARSKTEPLSYFSPISYHLSLIFYGFLVGVLLMTNALDGPIYLGLLVVVLGVQSAKCKVQSVKTVGIQLVIVIGAAILTSLPFLVYFKSFVTGLAVNCPLGFLANTKYGPLIFEGVEKCQVSPLWMWWLLWGFFIYCGVGLLIKNLQIYKPALPAGRSTNLQINLPILPKIKILKSNSSQTEQLLFLFFLFSLALVIFPEFLYFKDIYPMHFRSNTMFKLGYQAFILFSIVAGYTIVKTATGDTREVISRRKRFLLRRLFFIFLLPQLLLVSIFPIFAVRSYFGALKKYEGIYGLNWLAREYPDDWRAIEWLKKAISEKREARSENQSKNASFLSPITYRLSPVLVEADGDSYTDYARFSAFTGIPTIVGWPVHEWLWRGTYDVVAPRREEVRQIYESEDREVTRMILVKYGVRYVIVGSLEREKYKRLTEGKFTQPQFSETGAGFRQLGREVFRSGDTVIYRIQ